MAERTADPQHESLDALSAFQLEGAETHGFFDTAMGELMRELAAESRGVSWAISSVHQGHVSTWAASDVQSALVDGLQRSFEEGPTLAATEHNEFMHVPDAAAERRWPGYASLVVGQGVFSVLAVPWQVDGLIASLNLYARQPHSFTSEDITKVHRSARQIARAIHLVIQASEHRESKADSLAAARHSRALVRKALRTGRAHPSTGKSA
jgi:GAF domain-containing protein